MKEKIYLNSPYFIKQLITSIVGYQFKKRRRTKGYLQFLEKYNAQWKLGLSELQNIQKKELQNLLLEAYKYSQFYKERFDNVAVSLDDIKNDPYKVISKLPLLTKLERRNQVEQIVNRNSDRKTIEIGYTSGTSGTPTKNYLDQESIDRSFALWSRLHSNIGIKLGHKSVRFSGRLVVKPSASKPPFWIYNRFEKQLIMSTYHLKPENLDAYVEKLNRFKPKYLDGIPSAYYTLALYILKNKIDIKFNLIAIVTTAETLYDDQRAVIEQAFRCKVYNQYASSEGSPFITECTQGNLHINIDSGYFELLNEKDEIAKPGEIARLVVTSFRNLKTPLIRFDIKDSVLASDYFTCECGCNMPMVKKLIGREDDILWTKEKGYVSAMTTAFKGVKGLLQSQIIQMSETDFILNNIVDSEFSTEMEKKLYVNLKNLLGENINVTFKYVDEIPLGKNGKLEAVKRKFKLNR